MKLGEAFAQTLSEEREKRGEGKTAFSLDGQAKMG
jgi:hypothetical protein